MSPHHTPSGPGRLTVLGRPQAWGLASACAAGWCLTPLPVLRPSHEVRHAIASRGEARPRVSVADEQGRSSLPKRQETEGSGGRERMKRVDGLICWPVGQRRGKFTTERAQQTRRRLTIPVLPSTQHSIQPSVLDSALSPISSLPLPLTLSLTLWYPFVASPSPCP